MGELLKDLKSKKKIREIKFNALRETDRAELWYYMGQLTILDYVINYLEGKKFPKKSKIILYNDLL